MGPLPLAKTLDTPAKSIADSATRQTEAILANVQAISGALFFVFLVMHLSNTVLAAFGADTYNGYQRLLRQIYQQPALEILLVIGPLVTHTVAGVWLYALKRKWQATRRWSLRLQTWTGLLLLSVVFGHVLATRGIGYWYGAATGFEAVAFSLWWMPGYFYPYYFLLFMAGLYHGYEGLHALLKRTIQRKPLVESSGQKRFRYSLLLLGAAAVCTALLSFGGVLFTIDDPRDNSFAKQYAELFAIDLSAEP